MVSIHELAIVNIAYHDSKIKTMNIDLMLTIISILHDSIG